MRNRRVRPARTLCRRTSWCVALLAALLNALTPVFAYAIGQPLHEIAGAMPSVGPRVVAAQPSPAIVHAGAHAGHAANAVAHAGMHAAAHARHTRASDGMESSAHAAPAAPASAPAAPHCPYCLDFAAGAPLASAVAIVWTAQPGHAPLPVVASQTPPAARPSLRLPAPRGPPRAP